MIYHRIKMKTAGRWSWNEILLFRDTTNCQPATGGWRRNGEFPCDGRVSLVIPHSTAGATLWERLSPMSARRHNGRWNQGIKAQQARTDKL